MSIKMSCTILIYAVCIFSYILSWCSRLIGVNTAQRSCSNTLGPYNKAISSEYILGTHRTELSLPYSLFSLGVGIQYRQETDLHKLKGGKSDYTKYRIYSAIKSGFSPLQIDYK